MSRTADGEVLRNGLSIKMLGFQVAGSTSLSLLLVRLVVSHVLVPSLESTSILKTDEEGKPQAKERGGQDSSKSQTQQSEMVEGILKVCMFI